MAVTKRRIVLTPDNYPDYLPFAYPESLLDGYVVGEGGIDPRSPIVEQFCAWVNAKSARSKRREYVLSRSEASNILEWLAGWPDAPMAAGPPPQDRRGRTGSGSSPREQGGVN
jgi:hypothetical protein